MRKGRTDSTLSSLLDYAARGILHPLAPHIYLGVEYWNRLFSSGPYHSLLSDRRNQLHTFFFINRQSQELCWKEIGIWIKNTKYLYLLLSKI